MLTIYRGEESEKKLNPLGFGRQKEPVTFEQTDDAKPQQCGVSHHHRTKLGRFLERA